MRLRTVMATPRSTWASLRSARRAHREVVVRRHAGDVVGANDRAVVARLDPDGVAEVEQREQRLERVIAVGAPARHVQEQVHLRRRGNDHHGEGAKLSTTMRTSTGSLPG